MALREISGVKYLAQKEEFQIIDAAVTIITAIIFLGGECLLVETFIGSKSRVIMMLIFP